MSTSVARSLPALDNAAWHGLAGQVVSTLSPYTEADSAGLLVTFLAEFGAMCPKAHAIADGARHPARLNVVAVGRTSRGRKGTIQAQISRIIEAADSYFGSKRVFGGLASGEGLVAALTKKDDDGLEITDKRMVIFEPEFARVLKVCARDGSTLSTIIRDAWDRDRLNTMTRHDPLEVHGAHVSVVGHITAEELRRYMSETEVASGFGNRFLYVLVERSKRLPRGGNLKPDTLHRLASLVRDAIARASRIGEMHRTPDAELLWDGIYNAIDDDVDGMFGALTARAEAQQLRLSVAYALLDGSEEIRVDHVEAAKAVWDYCQESVIRIFGDGRGDPVADPIVERLRLRHPEKMSRTEIYSDLFGRHVSKVRIDLALDRLVKDGLVEIVEEETAGRPRVLVQLCAESAESAESV